MSFRQRASEPSLGWMAWVVALTILSSGVLAMMANKTGADEAVKRVTARVYGPLLTSGYATAGQEAITVVTIDDDDLEALEYSWPLGLDYYQRLVDHIVEARPRAIFLDLMFLDRKKPAEIASLIQAACRATELGIPFLLATVTAAAERGYTEKLLFSALTRTGKPCVLPVAPHVSPDALDQSQWYYPLRPRGQQFPSPALAMYCALHPDACLMDARAPLALVWGTHAAAANVRTMVTRVDDAAAPGNQTYRPLCRLNWHWWQVLPFAKPLHDWWYGALEPLCPYHQVLPVRAFQNQGFDAQERQEALRGKAVLIGTDLQGIGDSHVSPFHGLLPGVHVHAMALDNLISFQGQYKRSGDPEPGDADGGLRNFFGPALTFNLIALALTSTAMVLWRFIEPRMRRNEQVQPWFHDERDRVRFAALSPFMVLFGWPRVRRNGSLRRTGVKLILYFVTGGVVLAIGYGLLHQGPLAVVEYTLFPLLADTFRVGERIAVNLRDYGRAFWSDKPWQAWHRSRDRTQD